jgi:hypothetical protein
MIFPVVLIRVIPEVFSSLFVGQFKKLYHFLAGVPSVLESLWYRVVTQIGSY